MLGFARAVVLVFSALLAAIGLWLALIGSEGDVGLMLTGLVTAAVGVAGIVIIAVERLRYASEASEPPSTPHLPGGDDPGEALEPRFRATDEVFIDPSSGRTMRVYLDAATGERRYRVEA